MNRDLLGLAVYWSNHNKIRITIRKIKATVLQLCPQYSYATLTLFQWIATRKTRDKEMI